MTRGNRPVRVVAVTQSDPFFTARFFEAFLGEGASDRLELVEIVLLRDFNDSKTALVRRVLKLYGPVDFMRLLGRYVTAAVSDRVGRRLRCGRRDDGAGAERLQDHGGDRRAGRQLGVADLHGRAYRLDGHVERAAQAC